MRLFAGFVLAFALGLAPGAALAGWEATAWGMTPEQAQAAMPDLQPVQNGETLDVGQVKSERPYEAAGVKAEARLYYGAAGLEMVAVEMGEGRAKAACPKLVQAMLDRYGKPLSLSDQVILRVVIWHDEPRQTRVRMLVGGGGEICSLHFARLSTYRDGDLQGAAARP
jgi:hypothetical protein